MKIEFSTLTWVSFSLMCLNPYSNGMKIEYYSFTNDKLNACLNPYSNGMKIEYEIHQDDHKLYVS